MPLELAGTGERANVQNEMLGGQWSLVEHGSSPHIFFTGKKPGSKKCAIIQNRKKRTYRACAARGWRLAIPMSRGRCHHHCCGRGEGCWPAPRREAHSWNCTSNTSILVAPFGSGPVERVRAVTNPTWERRNSCKSASAIFIYSHGGGESKKPKRYCLIALRTAWPDRFDVETVRRIAG